MGTPANLRRRATTIAFTVVVAVLGCAELMSPSQAFAFEGCDLSGAWSVGGVPFATAAPGFLIEDAGALSGQLQVEASGLQSVSGSRSGPVVAWDFVTGPFAGRTFFSGTMSDCDTISGTVLGSLAATLTRLRPGSPSYCGDGNTDGAFGEQCDDGNVLDGDFCTRTCQSARCGNGIIEPGETCDDLNTEPNDACGNSCLASTCRDGQLDPDEECDDGNAIDGDGCSSLCRSNTCGDGILESDAGEECDDHNQVSGDDCSSLCQFEGCDLTGAWSIEGTLPINGEAGFLIEQGGTLSGQLQVEASGLQSVSGSRSGLAVSWNFVTGPFAGLAFFSGTMSSCNTISGTMLGSFAATLTRLRPGLSSYCGDGNTDDAFGEQCDDGNVLDGDFCTRTCQNARCGNGIIEPGELCDDRNAEPNDACGNTCLPSTCRNGQLDPDEQCDDGNSIDGDGCSALCRSNTCGDGIVESDAGEECDDHNQVSGDQCSSLCHFEGCDVTGYWRENGGAPTVHLIESSGSLTGDWQINTSVFAIVGSRTGTSVSWTVSVSPGVSVSGTLTDCNTIVGTYPLGSITLHRLYCGDGIIDGSESCDDRNQIDGDCCSAECHIEPADTVCRPAANDCDLAETCGGDPVCPGDVILPNGAPCSDGNACSAGDRCVGGSCVSVAPTDCNDGNACTSESCAPATGCQFVPNDGGCDDGLFCTVGDSCAAASCSEGSARDCSSADTQCTVGVCDELTDSCASAPVADGTPCDDGLSCTPSAGDHCVSGVCRGTSSSCGDGVVSVACAEQCDDGNTTDGDGCSAGCRLEGGWTCGGSPSSCAAECGDGTLDDGEGCDDAGTDDGDGCSSTCAIESGWGCTQQPSLCAEVCGDAVHTPGEECEDGNVDDGDGCESSCVLTPKSVSQTVPPGGTVRTDIESDGVNAADPVEAAITSPTGGTITVTRQTTTEPAPAGFLLFDQQLVLHVPSSLPPSPPLKLVFTLDAVLGPDVAAATVPVFRNGVLVPACTGSAGIASPDPCVASRAILANGEDLEITVYTTSGSTWTFGQGLCAAAPRADCLTSVVAGKSTLKITNDTSRDTKDKLDWTWAQGESTEPGSLGHPLTRDGYALCVYGAAGLLDTIGVGSGGSCGRRACWKAIKKGFAFADPSSSQSGVQAVKLLAGKRKSSKVQLRGKGAKLGLPDFPSLTAGTIVTQMVNGAGTCWEARFTAPFAKNDGKRFVDTAD